MPTLIEKKIKTLSKKNLYEVMIINDVRLSLPTESHVLNTIILRTINYILPHLVSGCFHPMIFLICLVNCVRDNSTNLSHLSRNLLKMEVEAFFD